VLCVTIDAVSLYAVGSVDLRIACDTKTGTSWLKFGFEPKS